MVNQWFLASMAIDHGPVDDSHPCQASTVSFADEHRDLPKAGTTGRPRLGGDGGCLYP